MKKLALILALSLGFVTSDAWEGGVEHAVAFDAETDERHRVREGLRNKYGNDIDGQDPDSMDMATLREKRAALERDGYLSRRGSDLYNQVADGLTDKYGQHWSREELLGLSQDELQSKWDSLNNDGHIDTRNDAEKFFDKLGQDICRMWSGDCD